VAGGSWGDDDRLAETNLASAQLPPDDEQDENPAGWRPKAGRAAARAAGTAGGRKRRLGLPFLLVLLALTVAVTALITRSIAGSGGSHHAAASVTQAVSTGSRGDGIVIVEESAGV
jgi:serine/threonine-protein kinase